MRGFRLGTVSSRVSGLLAALLTAREPLRSEWVAAVYLGGAHTNQTSLAIQAPGISTHLLIRPLSYAGNSFQSPLYYGYRGGYYFTRHFGLEGEFTHLKVYANTKNLAQVSGMLQGAPVRATIPLGSLVQQFNITHGVNALTGNFIARTGFGYTGESARFIVSARIGAGITIPHPENQFLGVSNVQQYEVGSPVLQVASGFELRLWRGAYVITEAKYTRTDETVSIAHGTATSLLSSTHFIAGFGWHFWRAAPH